MTEEPMTEDPIAGKPVAEPPEQQMTGTPAGAGAPVTETAVSRSGRRRSVTFVATTLGSAAMVALVMGTPTDLIDTPLFTRELPPTWWSYPVSIVTALLSGLLIATYVPWARPARGRAAVPRVGGVGGLIGFLAVGCPVCNKVVLVLLGASGAITYFEPVQPFLALASLVLLVVAVVLRFRPARSCPVPTRPDA